MAKEEMSEFEDQTQPELEGDVIVIKKSWLVTSVVAVVAFFLGGLLGYFAFGFAFQTGSAAAPQVVQAPQQQAPQLPAEPPARVENVSADNDPFLGPEDAPVTIVEFSDFQCPYCKRFRDQTFDALIEQYGDQIRIVYRDFPLSQLHPDAQKAAEAAECANEQGKFWEMHDMIYANQQLGIGVDALTGFADQLQLDTDEFAECVESGKYAEEVAADMADGNAYGVSGTPTFFINGYRLVGAQPLEAFTALIDQELGSN